MTKTFKYQQKVQQSIDNIKTPQTLRLNNDCGPTSDGQLSNNSHPTGVVKPVYGYPTFPYTAKVV